MVSTLRGATLALLAALPLLACESPTAAEEADRLIVESVDVRVMESFPVQVSALVKGRLRDECELLGETTQSRSDHIITVTIPTFRDNVTERPCIQETDAVEQDVRLEGAFPPGTYVVRVNGVERTFRVD
jgi:inhibitor of cysteine peptidase